MDDETRAQLRTLPTYVSDVTQLRQVVNQLETLDVLPGPIAAAYRVRADLDAHGATDVAAGQVGAQAMEAAESEAETDSDSQLEWICLALEVLFHRELHSDSVASPLLADPDRYLAPVRATLTWRKLTAPAQAGSPIRHAAGPQIDSRRPWQPDREHQLQLLLLPGPYGNFVEPVDVALRATSAVRVHAWKRTKLPSRLRTMGITRQVVAQRLRAADGFPVRGYARLAKSVAAQQPDVVFVDWADKTAMLTTLMAAPQTRIVLRVHGVDVLRPWIHLIDWSRVDAVICVSEPLRRTVRDVIGERSRLIPTHVIPNLVDLKRFGEVAEQPRDSRTLCMVGWAQRVKDPIWALEILARLRELGGDWKLMLIGADFDAHPTSSGAAYADRFRRRALDDDVRDHIEYTGYVHDLPPLLARVGFVLSTSLRESWPVGMAEAVAAGALPVVRQWPMLATRGGARAVWPEDWVVGDIEGAVARILGHASPGDRDKAAARARADLRECADPVVVAGSIREVVLGELGRLAHLSVTDQHAAAVELATDQLTSTGQSQPLLHQAAVSAGLAGEPSLRLRLLRRWAEDYPHPYVNHQVRRQVGRLRELTPGWRPEVRVDHLGIGGFSPPRILHVLKASLPYRQSGYAMRSFYLLREAERAGQDVRAVTALDFPADAADGEIPDTDLVGDVPHLRLVRKTPDREFVDEYLEAFATHLAAVIASERPSIIHVHSGHRGYELALVAMALAEQAGIPVVYEVRGFFEAVWNASASRTESAELYRLRHAVEAHCMCRAAAVVTLSESMREDILARRCNDPVHSREVRPVNADRVFVVPNGVDVESVIPRPRRRDLVDRHGLDGCFVFGYVSNLDHSREGHELLVEAVRGLRDQGVRAKALIVGDGSRASKLRHLACRRGVSDHVVFTGQVPHDEVSDYYALLDTFVVPRIDERAARLVTPLKPYEAMAMGLPLVVSDLPALQEIIGNGERGLAFPVGDANALQGILAQLESDPDTRASLGAKGREWVHHHRTWTAVATGYTRMYDAILADQPES